VGPGRQRLLPVALLAQHLLPVAPAVQQVVQLAQLRRERLPDRRRALGAIAGEYHRVLPVRLGALAPPGGPGPDVGRVREVNGPALRHRPTRPPQLVAPGGLQGEGPLVRRHHLGDRREADGRIGKRAQALALPGGPARGRNCCVRYRLRA